MEIPQKIYNEFEILRTYYPKLQPIIRSNDCYLTHGIIDIYDTNNIYWSSYEVLIKIPFTYPLNLPQLFETSKKIIRSVDWEWHCDMEGYCCLATNAKMYRELGEHVTLKNWFDKFAYTFLANHQYRVLEGKYAGSEFRHYENGVIDDYKELFELNTNKQLYEYFKLILNQTSIGINNSCLCGSGKKIKRCVLINREEHFRGVPLFVLIEDFSRIRNKLLEN